MQAIHSNDNVLALPTTFTCQNIIFVSYSDPGVVIEVPELDFAASDDGVGAVAVVVVVQRPVVNHGRQVRVVVLVGTEGMIR